MPSYAERIAFAARLAYGRWQPPAVTPAQTWEGFPDWWTSPVDAARDALGAGLAYVFTQVASDAARMSVMHLRKHARGWALDLVAAASGLARQGDERDGTLRARIAVVEDAVSADAVRAASSAAFVGVIVIEPWRHGLYLGRAPVDHAATRAAAALPGYDGRRRLYPVGRVRMWTRTVARIHLVLPRRGGAAYLGPAPIDESTGRLDPTGRLFLSRSVSAARSYLSSSARAAQHRALAATVERVRAAGVRWTASFDTL